MTDQPTEVTYDRLDLLADKDPIMLRDVAWAEIERLRAEVATLTAERDRLRARVHEVVDEANRRFAPFVSRCQSFDVRSAWARDLIGDDWLRTSAAVRLAVLSIIEVRDRAQAELDRQRPVIEAARAWAHATFGADLTPIEGDEDAYSPTELALIAAVDALDGAAGPSTSEPHYYVSTACHPHGLHQYCAAGIRADGSTKQAACCMHCGTPCRCACHAATTDEEGGSDARASQGA